MSKDNEVSPKERALIRTIRQQSDTIAQLQINYNLIEEQLMIANKLIEELKEEGDEDVSDN